MARAEIAVSIADLEPVKAALQAGAEATERVLALADELEAESKEAMDRAGAARKRDDRTMHAVNVRHARVAAHAAVAIRAAVEAAQ